MSENECRSAITENIEIVNLLKTCVIKNIVRKYYPRTLERFLEKEPKIAPIRIFDCLPGALLFHLESGDVIGFSGDDIKESVVVWFDIKDGVEDDTNYYNRELSSSISYDDAMYSKKENWEHLINVKIEKLTALKVDKGEVQYFDDSLQRAIILETSKGDMVISFCMLDLPEGAPFPLTRKADIPQEILNRAEIIEF